MRSGALANGISLLGLALGIHARQSLLFAGAGVVLLALCIGLSRRGALTLRFFCGWAAISVLFIAVGPTTGLLDRPASRLGITPTGLLLGISTTIALAIAMQLSIAVSRLQSQSRTVIERQAIDAADRLPPPASRDEPLVIVPAYNEEEVVGTVVQSLRGAGYACLVIDDGSSDATKRAAREAGAAVAALSVNLGVGGALRCGFRYAAAAGYRTIVQCDADGQHHPDQIPILLEALRRGDSDLVIGSRFADGGTYGSKMGVLRRGAVGLLRSRASRACGRPITDPTSGFRVIREPLLGAFAGNFPAHYLGDTYEALIRATRAGYRVEEVPVAMSARQGGTPSAGPWQSAGLLTRVILAVLLPSGERLPSRPVGTPKLDRTSG